MLPGPDFTPGDRVVWRHTLRGGYGYFRLVSATVRRVGKRVTIEYFNERTGRPETRAVQRHNLFQRGK